MRLRNTLTQDLCATAQGNCPCRGHGGWWLAVFHAASHAGAATTSQVRERFSVFVGAMFFSFSMTWVFQESNRRHEA